MDDYDSMLEEDGATNRLQVFDIPTSSLDILTSSLDILR
jgi:hypothetical protein